jgi:hypothetical protein
VLLLHAPYFDVVVVVVVVVVTRTRILIGLAVLAVICVAGWSIVPTTTAVTCTNAAGVARTWTTSSGGLQVGGAGSGSAAAAAPNAVSAADKASYHPASVSPAQVLAQLQQLYVSGAIDNGVDPITAAHQFGPWTVPGATGTQLAHAMDPATYGWHCP